jgi:predicted metal-dependent phosphoesterase TrpH
VPQYVVEINYIKGAVGDLHIHTTASDGAFKAVDIIKSAKAGNINTLAFTDHHVASAAYEAVADTPEFHDMNIISGIEISTTDNKNLHVLGYGMTRMEAIDDKFSDIANANLNKLYSIIHKLKNISIKLDDAFVEDMIQTGTIGRKRIAKYLFEKGFAPSVHSAYNDYIGAEGIAGVKTVKPTIKSAIEMIHTAGGTAVLAHPFSVQKRDEKVKLSHIEWERFMGKLRGYGLDGVECLPQLHGSSAGFFCDLAKNNRLIQTGGSDFHGAGGTEAIGNLNLREHHIDALLEKIAENNRGIEV